MRKWMLIPMGLFAVATAGSSTGDMPAYHTVSVDAYGYVNSDAINDITVARNGDVIATGYYDDSDDGDREVVLVRYDPQGHLLWRKVFGTSGDDEGHSVIETHDGDIVIVGYRTTTGEGADFLISRWSATGNRQYTCYWGRQTGHDEKLYAVIESSDHGLWATGYIKSFYPEGRAKVVLVNISPDGSELACVRAGKVADNWDVYGRDLCEVFDTDGFCVAGNVIDHDVFGNDQRILLAKFDDAPGYLWARRFGDPDYDRTPSTHAIIRTSDRCLALAGDEAFWNGIYMDYSGYVLKTDPDAHLAWGSKASGFAHYSSASIRDLTETPDQGIVATGSCYDFEVDPPVRVALTKYGFGGGIEWNHGFDCGSSALGRAVATSWDGYLVVGGSTNEYGVGGTDFLIASCTPSGHTCLETHDGPHYSGWSPEEEGIVLLSDGFDVDTTPWNHPMRVIPVERTPICAPRVLTVGDCLEDDEAFANIQAAIDASRDGDIIELCPGIYSGAGNRDMNFAGRQIVLREQDPDHANGCVIDCGGSFSQPHNAFTFHCGEGYASVIDGITIRDGHVTGNGGGILCTGGSPLIVNCTLDSCDAEDSGGGICCIDASPRIQQCRIIDCFAEWGGAMCCQLSSLALIGSEFTANGSYSDAGAICFNNCAGVTIRGCTFADNEAGGSGGALNLFYSTVDAENTIFWGDYPEEIYLVDSEMSLACCDVDPELVNGWYVEWLEGNINADPLFCGPVLNPLLPYLISGDSPCAPDENPDCGLIGAWPVGCNDPQDVPDPQLVEERLMFEAIGPNPFSGTTSIRFRVPSAPGGAGVILEVCDITGRLVRRLVDGRRDGGPHTVSWDGTNGAGQPLATGIYYCRLRAGDESLVKRLTLIR